MTKLRQASSLSQASLQWEVSLLKPCRQYHIRLSIMGISLFSVVCENNSIIMVYLKINDRFRFFLPECLHAEIILYINFVFFFSLIIKLWTICHSIRNFMHIILMVPLACFLKIYLPILSVGQSSFSLFYCGWISLWTHTRYLFYAKSCCEEKRPPFPSRFQPSRQGSYQEKNEIWNEGWQTGQEQSVTQAADLWQIARGGNTGLRSIHVLIVLPNCWVTSVQGPQSHFPLIPIR